MQKYYKRKDEEMDSELKKERQIDEILGKAQIVYCLRSGKNMQTFSYECMKSLLLCKFPFVFWEKIKVMWSSRKKAEKLQQSDHAPLLFSYTLLETHDDDVFHIRLN